MPRSTSRMTIVISNPTFTKLKADGFDRKKLIMAMIKYYFCRYYAMLTIFEKHEDDKWVFEVLFTWGLIAEVNKPHYLTLDIHLFLRQFFMESHSSVFIESDLENVNIF